MSPGLEKSVKPRPGHWASLQDRPWLKGGLKGERSFRVWGLGRFRVEGLRVWAFRVLLSMGLGCLRT